MIRTALALICSLIPGLAGALVLEFPGNAQLQSESVTPQGSYALPTGPWVDGFIPFNIAEGAVTRQAWRIDAQGLTTLQILSPLKTQLAQGGFDTLYECETKACGGFDFRFSTEILGLPDMYVDLGDYRYFAAQNGETDEYVTLIVSRSSRAGYVQVTSVTQTGQQGLRGGASNPVMRGTTSIAPEQAGDLVGQLETNGHVVLGDLAFETGSAQLGEGPFDSLQTLADYLNSHPSRVVALVGHTDSQGSLDGNIALSKRRAGSVLERLVREYQVNRAQLGAEGMGYLSPLSSNLSAEGREANRRVEVIMVSNE
ncbi:OmpA family protein [Aestuariibius sp. HNIBRBA575]|uniref:OmpA family protein n=1 Tax=Aestuariibius sp. HNIBRBA575 TaxID=3233343 RepID=UPI0034A40FFB